jgi:outer membrane lipoprotein-sorting protein
VRVESPKGRYSLRAVLVAKLPDRIRLEAFNPFGQTVGVLLQDQGKSTLWIPSEKVVYTASKTENLTGHFLGVPIPPEIFGYSLVACIPPDYLQRLDVTADASGTTRAVAAQQKRDLSLSWTLRSGPLAMESLDVRQGNRKYVVNYEPAADLVLVEAPRKISFTSADWQMEVTVNQVRNAPDLSDSVFNVTYPDGLKRVDLDEGK